MIDINFVIVSTVKPPCLLVRKLLLIVLNLIAIIWILLLILNLLLSVDRVDDLLCSVEASSLGLLLR